MRYRHTNSMLGAACLALAALPLAAQQGGPPPPAQTTVTATAVIRGRVLASATGAVITGAEVRLSDSGGRNRRLTTTDEQGQFDVRDLPSGQWTIMASKAGFVSQGVGQSSPLEASSPVTVANGQRLTVEIRLLRGSAIAGRVTSEYGDPIGGARVQVLRPRTVRGVRQLAQAGGDQADDLGAFRIYGLPPGDYYVLAGVPSPDNAFAGQIQEVTTYFPGTTRLGDAQLIRLRPGEDQLGVDIAAPAKTLFVTVSGIVLGTDGTPSSGAEVALLDNDQSVFQGARRLTSAGDQNGRFTFDRVPPGSYVVEASTFRIRDGAMPILTPAALAGFLDGTEGAELPIEVGTGNVTGLTLTMRRRPRVTLTGTIVTDSGAPLPPQIRVRTESDASHGDASSALALGPNDNGRFTLELTNRSAFAVDVATPGWMVKRIEIDGRETTDGALDFAPGATTASARVILTDRVAEVSGTVVLNGAPRASIVVFAADAARWKYPSRYLKATRTDAEGRFTVSGLPGERYRIIAVSYLEEDEFEDPEFLKRMTAAATDLRLAEGEKKTITLALTRR